LEKQHQFTKKNRLTSLKAFRNLREDSCCLKTKFIRAYFKAPLDDCRETKIGVSISKKVGSANIRNRLKRLIRESFRVSGAREKGVDVLFVASPFLFKFGKTEVGDLKGRERIFKRCVSEILSKLERI
jgi:ribonuclease P protein component